MLVAVLFALALPRLAASSEGKLPAARGTARARARLAASARGERTAGPSAFVPAARFPVRAPCGACLPPRLRGECVRGAGARRGLAARAPCVPLPALTRAGCAVWAGKEHDDASCAVILAPCPSCPAAFRASARMHACVRFGARARALARMWVRGDEAAASGGCLASLIGTVAVQKDKQALGVIQKSRKLVSGLLSLVGVRTRSCCIRLQAGRQMAGRRRQADGMTATGRIGVWRDRWVHGDTEGCIERRMIAWRDGIE